MEVFQEYGNDLVINSFGDVTSVDGLELTNQRIIRRLLTTPITVSNPPDYLANPTYGAGLPQFIGQLNTPSITGQIISLITAQMYLEQTVSQNPPPIISFNVQQNVTIGQISASITYQSLLTNTQVVISFTYPQNSNGNT